MIERQPTPDRIVDEHGQVQLGVFRDPLRHIDLARARVVKAGLPLPRAAVRLRLKEWQHYCLDLDDLFVTFAIVDSKFLRVTWCHVVDRRGGVSFEHGRQAPTLDLRLGEALYDDRCHVRARGYAIEVDNDLDHGEHRIRIEIAAAGGRPEVRAELRCLHDLAALQPLVVVLPVGPNRGMYSHKVPLPLEGTVTVAGKERRADPARHHAILDIHKALYPRHTWWNWATCAGRDAGGRLIGLNLTHNVNRRDDELNENGAWVDGALHHLGPARFEMDASDLLAPWRITTTDGAVELTFTPEGERADSIRLGVIRSVFHQPHGSFRGRVELPGGPLQIDDLHGVCEDHDALW